MGQSCPTSVERLGIPSAIINFSIMGGKISMHPLLYILHLWRLKDTFSIFGVEASKAFAK